MPPKFTILFILLLITLQVTYIRSCEIDQMQYGCRIHNGQCNCGYGCKAEYRYTHIDDCKAAFRGKESDICTRLKPCLHNGTCLQISTLPGYKCSCLGTGFHGPRCEKSCPVLKNSHFLVECMVI